MMTNVEPLLRLSRKERMEVAERLWRSMADKQRMSIPANHKKILDQHLEGYQAGKSVAVPHAEMMRRLRAG